VEKEPGGGFTSGSSGSAAAADAEDGRFSGIRDCAVKIDPMAKKNQRRGSFFGPSFLIL